MDSGNPGNFIQKKELTKIKDDIFHLHLCLKKRLYLEDYTKLAENCFRNGNYDKFWFRKVYFKGFLNNWIFLDIFTLFPP